MQSVDKVDRSLSFLLFVVFLLLPFSTLAYLIRCVTTWFKSYFLPVAFNSVTFQKQDFAKM